MLGFRGGVGGIEGCRCLGFKVLGLGVRGTVLKGVDFAPVVLVKHSVVVSILPDVPNRVRVGVQGLGEMGGYQTHCLFWGSVLQCCFTFRLTIIHRRVPLCTPILNPKH